uniref:Secreted protein n=1 Tax=Schistosoma curassoni TaxID=6186 RepID=A0A183JFI4_9TREM
MVTYLIKLSGLVFKLARLIGTVSINSRLSKTNLENTVLNCLNCESVARRTARLAISSLATINCDCSN